MFAKRLAVIARLLWTSVLSLLPFHKSIILYTVSENVFSRPSCLFQRFCLNSHHLPSTVSIIHGLKKPAEATTHESKSNSHLLLKGFTLLELLMKQHIQGSSWNRILQVTYYHHWMSFFFFNKDILLLRCKIKEELSK